MPFSWVQAKKNAIDKKIQRAITLSKGNINPDFDVQHPDWLRDAQNDNYTNLKKQIKEKIIRQQDRIQKRRDKLGGK